MADLASGEVLRELVVCPALRPKGGIFFVDSPKKYGYSVNKTMADVVSGFRQVVQDLLVPELKAVQVEVRHLNERLEKLEQRLEVFQQDVNKRFEDVNKRFEELTKYMNARFDSMQEQINVVISGQKEILSKLDLDKRLTKVETLVEQFVRKAV